VFQRGPSGLNELNPQPPTNSFKSRGVVSKNKRAQTVGNEILVVLEYDITVRQEVINV